MKRRTFLGALAGGLLAAPLAPEAQQSGKAWRIGFLLPGLSPAGWTSHGPGPTAPVVDQPFTQGMKDFGYVEGRDFVLEIRWAEGHVDRLPDLAADLVRAHVDIIVAAGTPATKALKQATQTIPIVFVGIGGAVEKGIVASLARPGGNLTGISVHIGTIGSKVLQLFKEAVPTLRRVVYLHDPASGVIGGMQFDAQAIKVEMQRVAVRDPDRVTQAFAEFKPGTDGLLLENSTPLLLAAEKICGLAMQRRLPTAAFWSRNFVGAGCLMCYGENTVGALRGAAAFVDKILKGARPADLPIEQPTRFELVINMKTAKALGLTIPESLLLRADEIIQ